MFSLLPRLRLALALLLLAVGPSAFKVAVAAAGPAQTTAADEMLQDAFDALDDSRPDLAKKIFETLKAAYPNTPAAVTASRELGKLADGVPVEARAPGPAEKPAALPRVLSGKERDDVLRRAGMRFLTEVGDRVFFAENSATIGGRARAVIEGQARWLKRYATFDVTIIGRADDGIAASEAKSLALERAKAVEALLVANGVAPERIKLDPRGLGDPVATCSSALCQAQNRHAESALRYTGAPGKLSRDETGAAPGSSLSLAR